MKRALALCTAGATLLLAGSAQATLVYTKNVASVKYRPSVWVANDDGMAPRRLVNGRSPRLSPDATQVLFAVPPRDLEHDDTALAVIPTAGGATRTLLKRVNNIFTLVWSPDSRKVLAIGGERFGKQSLKLIDVPTGASRTLAKGYFYGFSFSPDSQQVVFSRASREAINYSADLYVAAVAGGAPRKITSNARSISPIWGPTYIAHTRARDRRRDAPQFNVYRINPDGSGVAAITHDHPGHLVSGLTSTEFSVDGTKLLAQFGGQDTSYAVAVDPATGAEHGLGPQGERGFVASGVSKDGTLVLASSGGLDEAGNSDVVTVPWAGGKPTVLVRRADEPDWDR